MIARERLTATVDGGFVVFLIGMRINKPWKIPSWLPVVTAMPRMLKELSARPELGLLGFENWFGLTNAMVIQYWRSFEHLEAYARSRDAASNRIRRPRKRSWGNWAANSLELGARCDSVFL